VTNLADDVTIEGSAMNGVVLAAMNAFRASHGAPPVSGSTRTQAQECALNQGDGPACAPHYAWQPVPTRDGAEVISMIASSGNSTAWLLDPQVTSVSVGWAYQPGGGGPVGNTSAPSLRSANAMLGLAQLAERSAFGSSVWPATSLIWCGSLTWSGISRLSDNGWLCAKLVRGLPSVRRGLHGSLDQDHASFTHLIRPLTASPCQHRSSLIPL
jgi:hypothetical protein